jgi:predicted DNA-binding protein
MTERTTIRLPEELLKRAKEKAGAEGRTLTSLIEEGLRVILEARPEAQDKERVLPRISKARGGPRPGIDLVKTSKLLVDFDAGDLGKMR